MKLLTQKQPKQTVIALACVGLFALALPGVAQADVMANAVAQQNKFTISDATSGLILDAATDFKSLTYTSTGGYSGTYPGTPGYTASSSLTPVDLTSVCVGGGCGVKFVSGWFGAYGAENAFTTMNKLTAGALGNYSAADQYENGAPIKNVGALAIPANVRNGAYAGMTTDSGLSHATSTDNLNSNFIFQLAHAGGLTFTLDAIAYLQAYVTGTEKFPTFATASYTMDFALFDLTAGGGPIWTYTPDVLGGGLHSISLNAPLGVDTQMIQSNSLLATSSVTPALNNTDLYQLSARLNVNADVQRVPEPGALALLGIGLLGLLTVRIRTHQA